MGGYSDFMRALYIPASAFSDTPATIITPSAPFQSMDRIKLLDGQGEVGGKLSEQLFCTSNIQQFEFRLSPRKPSSETGNNNGGGGW